MAQQGNARDGRAQARLQPSPQQLSSSSARQTFVNPNEHLETPATMGLLEAVDIGATLPGFQDVDLGVTDGQPGPSTSTQAGQLQQESQRDEQRPLQQQIRLPAGFVPRPMARERFNIGRAIDLYKLHYEVLRAGGPAKVIQDNLWPVIGANLGFVNVPASGNEPAKADPALARRVANVYRDFLYVFDRNYTVSVARQWQQAQQQDILPGYTVVATWESVRQPSQADAWSISTRGEAGRALVAKMKEEYRGKLGTMRNPQKVSTDTGPSSEPTVCKSTTAQRTDAQRDEYHATCEQLFRLATAAEDKLPIYCLRYKEPEYAIRLIMRMVFAAQYQRELLSRDTPMYFMSLELMKAMINQLHAMNEALTMRFIPATPGCAPPDPTNFKQPQPSV
ncbi:hypothetical protein ONZ51_g1018 [Trametes cubensis]|uniref:ARID domain-containing protein n=1 Tax=Trametes cubensis TaxID=1111947 RepID=A0AAD7U299_9APHY|nr:hypothetical protein ONZ51_g1018 [Trametes cubensis]